MTKNIDPSFKSHMIYSFIWLIGGMIFFFLFLSPNDCDLETNPSCPEQLLKLQKVGIVVWGVIVATMVILRIIVHKYKLGEGSQTHDNINGDIDE
jgi:hypothetical protein